MMKFFDDFEWIEAVSTLILCFSLACLLLGPVFAIAYENPWYMLAWVGTALGVATAAGKGWLG